MPTNLPAAFSKKSERLWLQGKAEANDHPGRLVDKVLKNNGRQKGDARFKLPNFRPEANDMAIQDCILQHTDRKTVALIACIIQTLTPMVEE